ncbi:MAG: PQQ-like beta-propeller repeat protein [Chloroflexi bacterium]|jgi:outer membrane protein assembly factor BamB|nr:PQQ-like beta-propeller repeat protein [Chloroflexota bacterium]
MSPSARAAVAEHAGTLAGGACAVLALASLAWWIAVDPTRELHERRPGMDGRTAAAESVQAVVIGEHFEQLDGRPGTLAGSWPGFRGPDRDNIVTAPVSLAASWDPGGPPVLWSVPLGEGHAGAAVAGGRVYLLDYDETLRADALRCFSLDDGREIWRRSYGVKVKRNHGFSRTVPAVSGRFVVTIGPRGHVMCVDAETGELRWGIDLERDWGTTIPLWYTGQCPLIDGDEAVIAPAGKALLIGVELATGKVVWSVPNPESWQMSHTSVVPMAVAGRRMLVYSAIGGMVGVAADGPGRGTVLWRTTLWSQSVLAPTPLPMPGNRVFVTAGYGAGSAVLEIVPAGQGFEIVERQRYAPPQGLASEQQTPLLFAGHVFGIQPKDAGVLRNQLLCLRPNDLTRPVWASGPTHRFGLGPYLIADDKLLVLDDDGTLTLAAASTDGYRELARARVLEGVDAWAPMALAGQRLLLRDSRRLLCLDLGAGRGKGDRA